MKIGVFFFAFCTVTSLFGLASCTVASLFNFFYNFYGLVIVYSLWRKFQEHNEEPKDTEPPTTPSTIEQNVA